MVSHFPLFPPKTTNDVLDARFAYRRVILVTSSAILTSPAGPRIRHRRSHGKITIELFEVGAHVATGRYGGPVVSLGAARVVARDRLTDVGEQIVRRHAAKPKAEWLGAQEQKRSVVEAKQVVPRFVVRLDVEIVDQIVPSLRDGSGIPTARKPVIDRPVRLDSLLAYPIGPL